MELTYGGQPAGSLTVGLREGERRLDRADRRVLGLLAAPLAVAVHATVVSAELQASRERLVGAREEERRRLRRELHDGVGPTLTGIALTADAAANLLGDPPRARELLDSLRRDTRAALADVRRVVEDLRPPALDELGLVDALRQRAEQLGRRADGAVVRVRVDVPPDVPALPAAVEVAAYRIATEALTNIARHSQAGSAVVRLTYGDGFEVSVSDDGPTSGPWPPGTGLQAMRERVAELGGAFHAGPSPAGGRVHATFPWPPDERAAGGARRRPPRRPRRPVGLAGITARDRGRRCGRRRAGSGQGGGRAAAGRRGARPADAPARRLRRDPGDPSGCTRGGGAGADDVRRRGLPVRGDASGCPGIPREGCRAGRDRTRDPRRGRRGGDLLPGGGPSGAAVLRRPAAGRGSLPGADRTRARDPGPAGGGLAQQRHRHPARAVAEDGCEPPFGDVRQAAGRRPGGGHRARQGRRARRPSG